MILVVEDNDDLRASLVDVISAGGFAVASAANGVEALNWLESNPLPSAILLDMHMPIVDGHQFLAVQRATPRIASIPVIGLSGKYQKEEKGLHHLLHKPVEVHHLLAVLSKYR